MQIVVPVRFVRSRQREPIARAQLYNLDDNTYFNLQFNPQTLEPSREYGWSEEGWTGSDKIDLQFLGVGQTELEVVSDWLVDPAAPLVRHNLDRPLTYDDKQLRKALVEEGFGAIEGAGNWLVKIEEVIKTVEGWGALREDKRRSSLVRVIIGDNWYYNGRMTRLTARIDERFANGVIRRASIRIGFKEWKRPQGFPLGSQTELWRG